MPYFWIFLRGLAMGAADVVPGVSGGTVAFVTGIYQRLLEAIRRIHPRLLAVLFKQGLKAFWRELDGGFLLALALGVATSIISLAKGISWALKAYPQLLWALFFGLVSGSIIFMARSIPRWTAGSIFALLFGAVLAWQLTSLPMTEVSTEWWMVFLSGAIAICAMILPGISGSFILLLLGMYPHVLQAIQDRNIVFLAIFALGCVTGLLSFSHILSWTFKRYYNATMALLTGFMLGSLNKVWPWQNVLKTRLNSKGEEQPFLFENVLPQDYLGEAYLWPCIALMLGGLLLVLGIERMRGKEN